MDYDFKEMCNSLEVICNKGGVATVHPKIIMDAKIEFKDKIENEIHVDHCYIIDLHTCRCVLKGTYDYLGKDMCKPRELGKYFWLVWSIVYHYEREGLGLFKDYLRKLVPEIDWEFMSTRDKKPSEKCIENQRQKDMAAGVSTSSCKRKKEDNLNGQEDRRKHKGDRGKSKKEDNGNGEQGMKKRNGAVGKNTNNEEETEQEKRDKMRQLAASAALARVARTD